MIGAVVVYSCAEQGCLCVFLWDRMAAQTTGRMWSSTQVFAVRRDHMPADEAGEAVRCRCCPYGYHIDVDFLDYLHAIKAGSGLSQLKKIHGHRLRQRQAMETQLLMIRPPSSTPPPLGSEGSGTAADVVGESSGSLSPITPRSQSEDERDSASTTAAGRQLMADLDASIAEALNSIEALMRPRRPRTTDGGSDNAAAIAAAGYRSASTGDVRRLSGDFDGESLASTSVIVELERDPPSPLSTVSCSSLHTDGRYAASVTPEVFQPRSTQPLGINCRHANDSSNLQSSTEVELHRQTEITGSATAAGSRESSKLLPPSSDVYAAAGKSHPPRPPVKPRSVVVNGHSEAVQSKVSVREARATSTSAVTAGMHHMPTVPHSADEIQQRNDRVAEENRQAPQHSVISKSSNLIQSASPAASFGVPTTTAGSSVVGSSGRQLPVPPKRATEAETFSSNTSSKQSSFSSVRALISRKSGGSQCSSAARVDRPARRSRRSVDDTVHTTIREHIPLTLTETASAASDVTERRLQSSKDDLTGTTITLTGSTISESESKESIASSSCSSLVEVVEADVAQPQSFAFPLSLSSDQMDPDNVEVSFEELAKAMAILTPAAERPQDGGDAMSDRTGASPPPVNPDVLATIRKYIASSLQQMRMLEQQVKLVPVLQLRVSVLKEEKRLLKLQLQNAKNGSGAKTSATDACVGVTLSELPDSGKETDLPVQLERSSLSDQLQLQLPVERRDAGVGDSRADIALYCPSCKSVIRQQYLQSPNSAEAALEPEETTRLRYSELELSQDKNDSLSPGRSWSADRTVHGSVTNAKTGESSAFRAVCQPKPPVPYKEISIRREDGRNQSTVGIQCTLLKDSGEDQYYVPEILASERETVNKHMILERRDFRAQEPDLVTTHCLGGPAAVGLYPLKTFVDKETETDELPRDSAATVIGSPTGKETVFKLKSDGFHSPVQVANSSVNTDISGDIQSSGENRISPSTVTNDMYTQGDVRSPDVHEQMEQQTVQKTTVIVGDFTDSLASRGITKDFPLKHEVVQYPSLCTVSQDITRSVAEDLSHSVKDASCSADIVIKPATTDASSCTDEHLLLSSEQEVQVKPSVKDAECSVDITPPWLVTTGCNTELPTQPDVKDVGCSAVEEKQPMKDVSCSADIRLPECDKSIATDQLVDFVGATVKAEDRWNGQQSDDKSRTSRDVGCVTDSLRTSEMSSNTEESSTVSSNIAESADVASGSLRSWTRLSCVDAACLTDIYGKPSTRETGCNTDDASSFVEVLSSMNGIDERGADHAVTMKPSSASVALNTDAWLLTSDPAFLDSVKHVFRPSVTETASMTDSVEKLQTSEMGVDVRPQASECSTNTDPEVTPLLVDVESLARPAVSEVGCNTDSDDKGRESKDAATSVDIVLRPFANDVSVNTEAQAELLSRSVASNTDTTIHPSAGETASPLTGLVSGAEDVFPHLKDAASAEATPKPLAVHAFTQTSSEPMASTTNDSWSNVGSTDVSCGADWVQKQDREVTAKADTSEFGCTVALKPSLRSIACGIDAEVVSHDSYSDSVSDTADIQPVDDIRAMLHEKDVTSAVSRSQNVTDFYDAEAPVLRETREIACNTENMPVSVLSDDPLRLSTDSTLLLDASVISTVYWTNDEGTNICRLCGVHKLPVRDAESVTDIEPRSLSDHDTDVAAESKQSSNIGLVADLSRANEPTGINLLGDSTIDRSAVDSRQVAVEMKPETKDVGCDAVRSLTTDAAMNTDLSVDLLGRNDDEETVKTVASSTRDTASMTDPFQVMESVPARTGQDVACDTSDVILPVCEEASSSDNARFLVDSAVQAKLDAAAPAVAESLTTVIKCPTCVPTVTQDVSCGTDSLSLSEDLLHSAAADVKKFSLPSCTVCEVGCNTEVTQEIAAATAEAACNTTRTSTCDVGLNTDDAAQVSPEPTTIPYTCDAAAGRTDAQVAEPVTKDAFCITDIAIAPFSDDDEVLRKTDIHKHSRAVVSLPSTSEVACNTDDVLNFEMSTVSDEVAEPRRAVREVGCCADLTSMDEKPSTRDAGCTARPEMTSQSSATDPMSMQMSAETHVKAERTRTGLQVTRKAKKQSVTATARSTEFVITPTMPEAGAPVVTPTKSPTFDVACGTDVDFYSRYLGEDDGGLLRQLSADDVAEVLRRRRGASSSSSTSSPTCDVACNTEHDSRPLTPARVNYSRYYAVAAVDPPPPTAVDVACGPDTPSGATFPSETDRTETSSQDRACDTSDLPGSQILPELSASNESHERRPMSDVKLKVDPRRVVDQGTMTDHDIKPVLNLLDSTTTDHVST